MRNEVSRVTPAPARVTGGVETDVVCLLIYHKFAPPHSFSSQDDARARLTTRTFNATLHREVTRRERAARRDDHHHPHHHPYP